MECCRLALTLVLLLVGYCLSQERGGTDPKVAVPLLENVFSKAHVSGSLAYWGQCDSHRWNPDFPKLRVASRSGSPVEILREFFADDPKMRVTEESDGKIRMVETDVPNDLLNVKIHHLEFHGGPMSRGPAKALRDILTTPEVMVFRRANGIGPLFEFLAGGFPMPGNCCGPNGRSVTGELDNVTVAQALDYVLQTFPGFWLYESCQDPVRGRTAVFGFY